MMIIAILFLVGLLILIGGIFRRSSHWILSSGILIGVSIGSSLIREGRVFHSSDMSVMGAVILLAITAGLTGATILSRLIAENAQYWSLIPIVVLGACGLTILSGIRRTYPVGLLVKYFWLLLVILGLVLILFMLRRTRR